MFRLMLRVTTICLLIITLGCNKAWSIPENNILSRLQAQSQNVIQESVQGLVNLPLPKFLLSPATPEDIEQIEREVVELINEDRLQASLSPVQWDETAAEAARRQVYDEANEGFISHWGLDGKKPQQRYTLAGGIDTVNENQSVTLWLEGGFQGVSREQLKTIVTEHQKAMINETPPEDGHRRNILDTHHTGVGVAITVGKYGVAMAQEFTNHYADISPLPTAATPGATVTLKGQLFKGYQLAGVYGVWEELPQPLTKEQLMQTHSYSDPSWDNLHFFAKPQGQGYYVATPAGNVFAQNINVDDQGNFSLSIPLINFHALDYIMVEIAPNSNPKDTFYAAQFVIKV